MTMITATKSLRKKRRELDVVGKVLATLILACNKAVSLPVNRWSE
jgi:hypothetical protein